MTPFIRLVEKNVQEVPLRMAVVLDEHKECLTYSQLWEYSGRVYAYLKEIGIGKEDFVQICLPRNTSVVVAALGIWRAGAAFVVVEENYPESRSAFIREDCNCKLLLNGDVYAQMLKCDYLDGYEDTSPNDACFAIYTSGTTGTPKGILHEYGKLCNIVYNTHSDSELNSSVCDRYAYLSPMDFVAFVMEFVAQFGQKGTFYIVSYNIVKNVQLFKSFIVNEKITRAFMPPSLLKIYGENLRSLDTVIIAGESANRLYYASPQIINRYSMSEAAFVVARFKVDKVYDVIPVGKNIRDLNIILLGDDGKEVPDGDRGEVCFKNEYTRGYINQSLETEKVFVDGIYHTGDIGYKDENGYLYISGRKNGMIKINGNRIEPSEIEMMVKKIYGIDFAIIKAFEEEQRTYLVLYCQKSEIGDRFSSKNIELFKKLLYESMPGYMIPSYYVVIDEIPLNTNGKIDRKKLPKPNIVRDEYSKPSTELEERICTLMEDILKQENIGATDDFFAMGGDSLAVIKLISQLEGITLEVCDIYKYRTPRGIAKYCEKRVNSDKNIILNESNQCFDELVIQPDNMLIESYYASCFENKSPEAGDVINSYIEVHMKDKIDEHVLQKAIDNATERCPYVTYGVLRTGSKPAIAFRNTGKMLKLHLLDTIDKYGTAENNGHYTVVSYKDNIIRFSVSHLLTDAFGINNFVGAVLGYYVGNSDNDYAGAKCADYAVDLMAKEWPVSSKYKYNFTKEHFEFAESRNEEQRRADIILKYADMNKFCEKYGLSMQGACALIMGKIIQNMHPDNRKVISVRGPINSRIFLGAPNTFQNASIPHMFFTMEASKLVSEDYQALAESINREFAMQYTYDYIAAYTNKISRFVKMENEEERQSLIKEVRGQTKILATYLGDVISSDKMKWIDKVRLNPGGTYPLMLYAYKCGDLLTLTIVQSIDNRDYAGELRKVLKELKIKYLDD